MIRTVTKASILGLGLALSLAACDDSTAPGGTAQAEVFLRQGDAPAAALAPAALLSQVADPSFASVPLSNVASIDVTITGVQVLPISADPEGEAQWIPLDLTAPATLDLVALPVDDANALRLARGELAPGTYGNLRLMFSDASITFSEQVRVGQVTYPAGEAIPLIIPSGPQNGIRVPTANFTVTETDGDEVIVVFDAEASTAQIVATGANRVQMSPVLGARSDND